MVRGLPPCNAPSAGVSSIIVERAHELTRHPQAHFINNRTMEIFRAMGDGLADEVWRHVSVEAGGHDCKWQQISCRHLFPVLSLIHLSYPIPGTDALFPDNFCKQVVSVSPPLEEWRRFIYCRSLSGQILGQVDHFEGMDLTPFVDKLDALTLLRSCLRTVRAGGPRGITSASHASPSGKAGRELGMLVY